MNDTRRLSAIVMAAGQGTRMRSAIPKHLHPLLGRRMVDWVLDTARAMHASPLVVVASPETRDAYDDADVVVQERPLGTGDAVATGKARLGDFDGDVLVLDAAAPLLTPEHLSGLVDEHAVQQAAVTVLTFHGDDLPYGRIVRSNDGSVQEIVEDGDASAEQRAIRELNSSIYVFDAAHLWQALERLEAHNAQGELYLTDCVRHIVEAGGRASAWICPEERAALGINTRAELAIAAAQLRDRINEQHMLAGVTIVDPASTWIEVGVVLEADVTIHPFTVIRGDVTVRRGVEIGPFAYVRPGTHADEESKIGTFVEVKNSRIGARTKIPHLSYVGDADIGEDTNVAAGNITANFPHEKGQGKQRTTIGRNVRTGVDNSFLAPVTIGDNAWVAAGSVITEDVPPDALAIARARQENKEGYAGGKRHD
jgi:bifunctional UDP-N-acetylglucosamine pyrophosphorylase / glucosamine-1-phosphate N-acetyltransferase